MMYVFNNGCVVCCVLCFVFCVLCVVCVLCSLCRVHVVLCVTWCWQDIWYPPFNRGMDWSCSRSFLMMRNSKTENVL